MSMKQHIPGPVKAFLLKGYAQYRKTKKAIKTQKYILEARLHPSKAVYYCPCCDNRLCRFVDGKYNKNTSFFNPKRYQGIRQDVVCPICGTIPRHRILTTWFQQHKDALQGRTILYFACERGCRMWLERNHIPFTTADYYAPADLKLDLCKIDQPDDSWDWIVCNHVLEHVESYQDALHELYRILKPGGKLIISFPILPFLPTLIEETEHTEENKKKRLHLYGQADHLRIFGTDSKALLIDAGFKVSIIDGRKTDKRILPVVGPADYDTNYLFLCEKPENA